MGESFAEEDTKPASFLPLGLLWDYESHCTPKTKVTKSDACRRLHALTCRSYTETVASVLSAGLFKLTADRQHIHSSS